MHTDLHCEYIGNLYSSLLHCICAPRCSCDAILSLGVSLSSEDEWLHVLVNKATAIASTYSDAMMTSLSNVSMCSCYAPDLIEPSVS